MSELKKLAEEGAKAQAKFDAEEEALKAPTPPSQSWQSWWRENESVRQNPLARINAFESDNLKAFQQTTHLSAHEFLCDDCAVLRLGE
jgi:hypothetical protein